MDFYNIEVKAKTVFHSNIKDILSTLNANFIGKDYQTDTYYKVKEGRLKVRKGNIENFLIYYIRSESSDIKKSNVIRKDLNDASDLYNVLLSNLEIMGYVKKVREIYMIENVKIHLDNIEGLGEFIEIEAKNESNDLLPEYLHKQCNEYMNIFYIQKEDIVNNSYIDLVLNKEVINKSRQSKNKAFVKI